MAHLSLADSEKLGAIREAWRPLPLHGQWIGRRHPNPAIVVVRSGAGEELAAYAMRDQSGALIVIDAYFVESLSSRELRGLVFHEYGHLWHADDLRRPFANLLLWTTASVVAASLIIGSTPRGIYVAVAAGVIALYLRARFERASEYDADGFAVILDGDSRGLAAFYRTIMMAMDAGEVVVAEGMRWDTRPRGPRAAALTLLHLCANTHPTVAQRLAHLQVSPAALAASRD